MSPRVAVVGCGHWGKNLVRNMAELGALAAVCDHDRALAEQFAQRHDARALDFDAALASSDIDGVVLASPAHLHAKMALAAFEAGKHVFVEKPISLDIAEAEAMIAAAERRGLTLMVGHLLQYHAAYLALKAMVAEGALGKLRYVYSHRLNIGKLRTEEDVFWSFAPHDVSMILGLTGEEPDDVQGIAAAFLQPLADFHTLHLSFPSGARGHVMTSWLHPTKEQKLVAVGETGMAVFDDLEPWERKLMLYRHVAEIRDGAVVTEKDDGAPVTLTPGEPLKEECRHFLDSISGNTRPRTDGEEALRVLRVLMKGSVAA